MSDNTIEFPNRLNGIAEAGGLVDESSVTLGIYGDSVDPEAISKMLECQPTSSHRMDDPRGKTEGPLPPWPSGAWLLTLRGSSPEGPEELTRALLMKLPVDPAVLQKLSNRHNIRIMFGLHLDAWNRGFDLTPSTVERLAAIGATVGFDIYANADDLGPQPAHASTSWNQTRGYVVDSG